MAEEGLKPKHYLQHPSTLNFMGEASAWSLVMLCIQDDSVNHFRFQSHVEVFEEANCHELFRKVMMKYIYNKTYKIL